MSVFLKNNLLFFLLKNISCPLFHDKTEKMVLSGQHYQRSYLLSNASSSYIRSRNLPVCCGRSEAMRVCLLPSTLPAFTLFTHGSSLEWYILFLK